METNLDKLEKEVSGLDLKFYKDFIRFEEIKSFLYLEHEAEISKGRCQAINIIVNKEEQEYDNYPSLGYETFPYIEGITNFKAKTFEEMQKFYNDMSEENRNFKNRIKYGN